MGNKNAAAVKKVFSTVLNVLTFVFFGICVFALVLSVSAKKNDGAANIFGKQVRIVISDSMAKCDQTDVSGYEIKDIPIKSMLLIDLVPEDEAEAEQWYSELEVGDVLTFRYLYATQETITHRITSITPKATGGYIIELEGDNKASDADTLSQTIDTSEADSPNYVIGKVTWQNLFLGLVLTAAKSPVGIICIVIIPCIIIAIFEVIKLVGALTAGKREKQKEEQQRKDDELEELKRQIELLQQQQAQMQQTAAVAQATEAQEAEASETETEASETAEPPQESEAEPTEKEEVEQQ